MLKSMMEISLKKLNNNNLVVYYIKNVKICIHTPYKLNNKIKLNQSIL